MGNYSLIFKPPIQINNSEIVLCVFRCVYYVSVFVVGLWCDLVGPPLTYLRTINSALSASHDLCLENGCGRFGLGL